MPVHLTDPNAASSPVGSPPPAGLQARLEPAPSGGLIEAHKKAITDVVAGFYRELSGKWQASQVLVDIWQGPNAVMVEQLNASPMSAGVAKSLISMLDTITQAKLESHTQALRDTGALQALYGIAFGGAERLDLLPYAGLPKTALSEDEARAWVRCCITLAEVHTLHEPVVIRADGAVHLFEWAALKQFFRESFRFINPMTRKPITAQQLWRLEPEAAASKAPSEKR